MKYGLYLGILGAYGILFLLGRGGFQSAAAYLRKKNKNLSLVLSTKTLAVFLMIFFASDLLAIAAVKQAEEKDTARQGYLYREEYGGSVSKQTVSVKTGDKEEQVQIELEPRMLSEEEIDEALKDAEEQLPKAVLGEQNSEYVTESVTLPDSIGSPAVDLSWITDNPDIIDWDGTIGQEIPTQGTEVTLTCELSLEDSVRETSLKLMVFPKKQTAQEKLEQEINEEVSSVNSENAKKVALPEEISGEKVRWSSGSPQSGTEILAFGILIAAVYAIFQRREAENKAELRNKGLKADYPKIVSRFVLFMNAGLSVRMSLNMLAEEYRKQAAKKEDNCRTSFFQKRSGTGKAVNQDMDHPGFAEICHVADDMNKGMTEMQAYDLLGKRCQVPEYKTFSDLLIRCTVKGGRDLLNLMQKEADEAEEMRRKAARTRGEEAGTKLLLPMVMMLAIVMAILMVPAMLNMTV